MMLDEYNIGRIAKLAKMNRPNAVGLVSLPGRLPTFNPARERLHRVLDGSSESGALFRAWPPLVFVPHE
jgi:hypothetical protein